MLSEEDLIIGLEVKADSHDASTAKTAKEGLKYAEQLSGAEKRDVLRHYLYKAKQKENIGKVVEKPEYEGRVLRTDSCTGDDLTGYTIIDVATLEGSKSGEVDAALLDVTGARIGTVNADIIDANIIAADEVNADISSIWGRYQFDERTDLF